MEGKMDVRTMTAEQINELIAQLRRELEELKGYEAVVHKAFLEGPADIRVVQMAYDIANLKSKVEAEKKRANLNERALELACGSAEGVGTWFNPAHFRKLAESK